MLGQFFCRCGPRVPLRLTTSVLARLLLVAGKIAFADLRRSPRGREEGGYYINRNLVAIDNQTHGQGINNGGVGRLGGLRGLSW